MSADERSGERDLAYSKWHRSLGGNFPTCDIDWVEYHLSVPVALIETKYGLGRPVVLDASLASMLILAWTAGLPAFWVNHDGYGEHEPAKFEVHALNEAATHLAPQGALDAADYAQWIKMLHGVRVNFDDLLAVRDHVADWLRAYIA